MIKYSFADQCVQTENLKRSIEQKSHGVVVSALA